MISMTNDDYGFLCFNCTSIKHITKKLLIDFSSLGKSIKKANKNLKNDMEGRVA